MCCHSSSSQSSCHWELGPLDVRKRVGERVIVTKETLIVNPKSPQHVQQTLLSTILPDTCQCHTKPQQGVTQQTQEKDTHPHQDQHRKTHTHCTWRWTELFQEKLHNNQTHQSHLNLPTPPVFCNLFCNMISIWPQCLYSKRIAFPHVVFTHNPLCATKLLSDGPCRLPWHSETPRDRFKCFPHIKSLPFSSARSGRFLAQASNFNTSIHAISNWCFFLVQHGCDSPYLQPYLIATRSWKTNAQTRTANLCPRKILNVGFRSTISRAIHCLATHHPWKCVSTSQFWLPCAQEMISLRQNRFRLQFVQGVCATISDATLTRNHHRTRATLFVTCVTHRVPETNLENKCVWGFERSLLARFVRENQQRFALGVVCNKNTFFWVSISRRFRYEGVVTPRLRINCTQKVRLRCLEHKRFPSPTKETHH